MVLVVLAFIMGIIVVIMMANVVVVAMVIAMLVLTSVVVVVLTGRGCDSCSGLVMVLAMYAFAHVRVYACMYTVRIVHDTYST